MDDSKIIIYQTEDGNTKIETSLEDETVWLTQAQLAEFFQKAKSTISEHIKIFLKKPNSTKFSCSEFPVKYLFLQPRRNYLCWLMDLTPVKNERSG